VLKPDQLGRVLRMQAHMDAANGEPGMPVPRDRMHASHYRTPTPAAHQTFAKKKDERPKLPPFPAMRAPRKKSADHNPGK